MVKMICAHGINGEFGLNDGLPWDCPEDLAHFKEYTTGCILVMSGPTFASLPFKLPGRRHIVLSDTESVAKNGDEPDFIVPSKTSLETLCRFLEGITGDTVCVIGGRRQLIEASLFVDAASVTEMCNSYEATHYIDHDMLADRLSSRMDWEERKLTIDSEVFLYENR